MMIRLKTKNKIAIIITAAGSSTRMGGSKKEYLSLKNGTVLSSCAKFFFETCKNDFEITDFIVTCPKNKKSECENALFCENELLQIKNKITIVEGGKTRRESVFEALKNVKNSPEIVLIHDGARPFVTKKIILDGIKNAFLFQAAVPAITPIDTQKRIDKNGFIIEHLERKFLAAVQTPQCFNFEKLFFAHKKIDEENLDFTDDTAIWGKIYPEIPVKTYEGDVKNLKITYPQDLENLK